MGTNLHENPHILRTSFSSCRSSASKPTSSTASINSATATPTRVAKRGKHSRALFVGSWRVYRIPSSKWKITTHDTRNMYRSNIWNYRNMSHKQNLVRGKGTSLSRVDPYRFCSGGTVDKHGQTFLRVSFSVAFKVGRPIGFAVIQLGSYLILSDTHV